MSGYRAVVETLAAIREQVSEEIYLACAVLGGHEQGLTEAELRTEIEQLLNKTDLEVDFPWYLGISKSMLCEAKKRLSAAQGFENLMKGLRDDDWIEDAGERVKFKPRHFTWGFSKG